PDMKVATLALLLALMAAPAWAAGDVIPQYIGVAWMLPDGTIVLRLRTLPPGPIGEGQWEVKPGDPTYDEVLRHIGGLAPGETKSVPAWPD
ncbi:MAG: hypothetical protein ACHQF3_13315, partial [Alphaproteobacteria bacterium]